MAGLPEILVSTPACIPKCFAAGVLEPTAISDSLEILVLDEVCSALRGILCLNDVMIVALLDGISCFVNSLDNHSFKLHDLIFLENHGNRCVEY